MLLERIFGGKSKESHGDLVESRPPVAAPAAPKPAPAAPGIKYHPDLVNELHADHKRLLTIFGAIQSSFQAGDHAATASHLNDFRAAIQSHLLTENVKLYIYLTHALANDPGSRSLMQGFRHEMDNIGRAVLAFLEKYRDIATQPALQASFSGELAAVGRVLSDRIQREEATLYPLYLPAY